MIAHPEKKESRSLAAKLFVISLRAPDIATATRFYKEIVGLPLAVPRPDRPHFDLGGGTYLVILEGTPSPDEYTPADRFPRIAFEVDDLEATLDRLRSAKVELPWGVEKDGSRRWAAFHDPAGNLIEIVKTGEN
jgi:catechol 2,3-dioxygenase-like lactoylglutathione lyase family enzyme